MYFQGAESTGKHTALTLEVRSLRQAYRSHILETREFLKDRCLETHSLLKPFLPWRNIAFPEFCVLRITHCLNTLPWRSFLVTIYPDGVATGMASTLQWKSKPTSKRPFHHIFSVGEIPGAKVCLENSLYYGDTSWVWSWIQDLGGKMHIFL